MKKNSDTLIISPVYNESSTLKHFLRRLRESYKDDLLIVDDGSTDDSREIIQSLECENTSAISHTERCGYGCALQTGFDFAMKNGYNRIITMDTDLQHNPERAPHFFEKLNEYDVVLGSRYMNPGDISHVPPERYCINRRIANLFDRLFSVKFSDPFCGYRGFSRKFLEKAEFEIPGYGFALETLTEMIRTGVTFTEITVELIYLDDDRIFMDGLDNRVERYKYYLEVIYHKRKKMYENEKISGCITAS